jgi:hypothetical protein
MRISAWIDEVDYIPFDQDAANLFFQLVSSRRHYGTIEPQPPWPCFQLAVLALFSVGVNTSESSRRDSRIVLAKWGACLIWKMLAKRVRLRVLLGP